MFVLAALISIIALYMILDLVLVLLVLEEDRAVGHAWSREHTHRFFKAVA